MNLRSTIASSKNVCTSNRVEVPGRSRHRCPFATTYLFTSDITVAAVALLVCSSLLAQASARGSRREESHQVKNTSQYIEQTFRSEIGDEPTLGWVLQGSVVVTEGTSDIIAILSDMQEITLAYKRATLTSKDAIDFARKHRIACDIITSEELPSRADATLSVYDSTVQRRNRGNRQVFITRKPLLGSVAGYKQVSIPLSSSRQVWQRMHPQSSARLRRSFAIGRKGLSYFYSFAAIYGGPHREMSRHGMFLHAADGRVIATDIADINVGTMCDGCAVPRFDTPLQDIIRVINLFTIPSFRYPLLMLDTSTLEGSAKSLVTFSPAGEKSEYRLYEYVVGCW